MEITATKSKIGVFVLGLVGMIALAGGSLFIGLLDTIIRFFLEKELVLLPGHEFFDIWKEIPLPVYQKIYIFNITNPEAFSKYGTQPIVKELGPFVFQGKWTKENIQWNDEDGTVTYKDVKKYTFVPELSTGSQDDKIYTLNGPLLAVINYAEDYTPYLLRPFVVQIINGIFEAYNESLLVHRTIREMVYEGYHEPMVQDLTNMVEPFVTLPLKLVNNTFGILHERSHVGDGVFTIDSGVNGIDSYAHITKWNNKSTTDWWKNKYCDQINGTDGVQYPPGVTRDKVLSFFNPNLCRSAEIHYERDITVHGIKTLRFGFASDLMASPEIKPDNKCYCSGHKCHVSGILPLNCKQGAPYVISNPHFFEADPELQTSLVGIQPSAEKHKSFFDIEPITGVVLNAAVKLQLNGVVKRLRDYTPLKHVGESIVPVLWLSEEATLDTYFANYFKSRVATPLVVVQAMCIAGIALGAIWTISAICFACCIKGKMKPIKVKRNLVMNTLQSVYTSVALWPPTEEELKEHNQNMKGCAA